MSEAQPTLHNVVIVGGNRIPFARSNTAYTHVTEQQMMTAALDGLIARYGLQGERIGTVAGGAVMKHPKDFNLMRESVLGSALDPQTPAVDVQMACATGMEAIGSLANKIRLGQIASGIGGGVDSASDAPIVVSEQLRTALLELNRAKTWQQKLKAVTKISPAALLPQAPGIGEPRTGLSMGEHMARTAAHWKITRQEQDEIAVASHHNLAAAYERGFFDDLMTPFHGLTADNNLRADTSMEKLAKLSPVFGKSLPQEATMTAGNSTALTDGASSVLLGSEEWAASKNLPMLANFVDFELAAVDFVDGAEGLLMAPAHAVARLLQRNNLTFADFDFFEIHEAFAATVAALMKAWESAEYCKQELGLEMPLGSIDRSKLNVNGSSLATGHPFAATGGRLIASTAKLVAERGGRALISVCAAGGQAVAAIVESR
ncbi:acetyl-CoA C-acetyltransferase [Micrococcoides hystricis]|uniref:Acetyl-CoA C-acetyltransferase n=1 Tax=Micrococcoides hystricis TaxID=1572761 RepID=A0ABV6P9F9_9MICC